jgi:hypothetical protein
MKPRAWVLATALGALLPAPVPGVAGDDPPVAFKRYLPRGQIPSLENPAFVSAAEADTPPDAWVLGVILDGQARAYELNLLTRHEVINDRFGDEPVAVVWCPLANSAVVYDRRVGERELRFEPSGVLMHGSIVLQDKETDSFWPIIHGRSLYGALDGTELNRLPAGVKARFGDWREDHPETLVWSWNGMEHLPSNPMTRYLNSEYGFRGEVASDDRLRTKDLVFAFELDGRAYAAPAPDLEGGRAFAVDGQTVFLYRPAAAELHAPTRAYLSPDGFRRDGETWLEEGTGARFDVARETFTGSRVPEALLGFDTFWYVWSLNHPETVLLGR